jgi:chromosomal replication initiation ATPase DnaA
MTDIGSDNADARTERAMFLPGFRSRQILESVATKHKLRVADIIGRERWNYLVAARRDAITAMRACGMTQITIARAMCRDRTTIVEYTNADRRERKREYRRARAIAKRSVLA